MRVDHVVGISLYILIFIKARFKFSFFWWREIWTLAEGYSVVKKAFNNDQNPIVPY